MRDVDSVSCVLTLSRYLLAGVTFVTYTIAVSIMCLKLTTKIPERRLWRHLGSYIVGFEQVIEIAVLSLLLVWNINFLIGKWDNVNREIASGRHILWRSIVESYQLRIFHLFWRMHNSKQAVWSFVQFVQINIPLGNTCSSFIIKWLE